MNFRRSSGILLHPTSLPGPYGIGDLGPQAYRWVDWLAEAGCSLWQVLPLGPTGYGDSPYQCFSAFAGNPYLISPDFLLRDGLLHAKDLSEKTDFPLLRVDYGALIPWKLNLLDKAFNHFSVDDSPAAGAEPLPARRADFEAFCAENAFWLDEYALFMSFKEAFGGGAWDGWPADLCQRQPVALEAAREAHAAAVNRYKFYQFLFYRQWADLRQYAHSKGIQIIGDIPIFVAYDSADVWAHPELFYLDDAGKPTVVAGVPPDYFSPTGQLWGNPLYRWDVHQSTGYAWWLRRFRTILQRVDIVRLDHFRGFAGYWEVPAGEPTAVKGRWVPGPGADFFHAVVAALGAESTPARPEIEALPIIAEDLGEITPDVIALRKQFHLPGMKVLQFAFSGPENAFLPHHYPESCVVYTGTHDNDTSSGWYASAPQAERDFARQYLCHTQGLETDWENFAWDLIRTAWASTAVFALAPMQDFLLLGTAARMNYPSLVGGNWEWRMGAKALNEELKAKLKKLNYLYSRG